MVIYTLFLLFYDFVFLLNFEILSYVWSCYECLDTIAVCRVVSPISRGRWLAGSVIYQECVYTAVTGTFVTLTVPPQQTPPSTPSKSQQVLNTNINIATEYRVQLFAKVLVKLLFNFFCLTLVILRLHGDSRLPMKGSNTHPVPKALKHKYPQGTFYFKWRPSFIRIWHNIYNIIPQYPCMS